MMLRSAVVVVGAGLALATGEAHASITTQIYPASGGIYLDASGEIDTNLLSLVRPIGSARAYIDPSQGTILFTGKDNPELGYAYSGVFKGPSGFGSGRLKYTPDSGDHLWGFSFTDQLVYVPFDYVSGSYINVTMFFPGQTYADLGLSQSTYTWTYGGPTGFDTVTINIQDPSLTFVPLPSSAPMFGAALLVLGGFGYGLRRGKAAAHA